MRRAQSVSEHDHQRPPAAPKRLNLADVLMAARSHLSDPSYPPFTRKALHKLALCRTGHFGHTVLACPGCGHEERRPRGCGLRHCPSCGHTRAEDWIKERKLEMLDCPYYQLVFTLPPHFYALARENPKQIYTLLLDAVRDTLVELARDPKHLGGIPQLLLALHTWNSALDLHLHVHALMAAGAYNPETKAWIPAKNKAFLFSIKVLSKLFRGKFLDELKRLNAAGRLAFEYPANQDLKTPAGWKAFLQKGYATPFFTYVEKPAAGPENVLEYLGHYLYRTGISNGRLVSLQDRQVTFACKDRKKRFSETGSYNRVLPLNDFVDLFAQHILPKGFHRVRFGGLWSGRHKKLLPEAKEAVARWSATRPAVKKPPERPQRVRKPDLCPDCGRHELELQYIVLYDKFGVPIYRNAPARAPPESPPAATSSTP